MLKSILLTSLLTLPLIGMVQAAPFGTPERSAEIRAQLSVNRAQYDDFNCIGDTSRKNRSRSNATATSC